MNENPVNTPDMASIAAVERDTGLPKDTLRMWERRYGFPQPLRDANGERLYPGEQIEKLRLLRRLLDNGHRPGKVVPLERVELVRLIEALGGPRPSAPVVECQAAGELSGFINLLRRHQTETLRQALLTKLTRIGLERFVIEVVAPMATMVGDAWARGELAVFEEHLFTEQMTQLLRNSLNSLPRAEKGITRPRLLLTTFPQEPHGLGLLMAEALLALYGCACVSLGVQTPLPDIVMAARAHAADIVALSFSPCMNGTQVIEGLAELQNSLPAGIDVWAGGSHPVMSRRTLPGVVVLRQLTEIESAVDGWRSRYARP